MSTSRRRGSDRGVGERVSYGSARMRAMERRRKRILRRRILFAAGFLVLVCLIGGILFGISNGWKSRQKMEFLETGIACMKQENYEEAIVNFEKELEAAGGHVGALEEETLLYRAEAEYRLQDYSAALHTYQILLKKDKHKFIYQKGVALALLETGDLEGALEMHVIDAYVYNRMAKEQIESGQYDEALVTIGQGISELDFASSEVQSYTQEEIQMLKKDLSFNQAVAYEYKSDYQKALELFEAYISDYGPDANAEREITFLKTRQGNY
ncbi:MAG: tetratricopeptide repeat protein [Brotaphodocola sp.]